ncbi:hypothetical protein HDU92_000414 [Lobulomyces angularis]|nr:hypothetical protein HDU92_000414 [Lobulomyces angularis]
MSFQNEEHAKLLKSTIEKDIKKISDIRDPQHSCKIILSDCNISKTCSLKCEYGYTCQFFTKDCNSCPVEKCEPSNDALERPITPIKKLGESCGGVIRFLGICDEGLYCRFSFTEQDSTCVLQSKNYRQNIKNLELKNKKRLLLLSNLDCLIVKSWLPDLLFRGVNNCCLRKDLVGCDEDGRIISLLLNDLGLDNHIEKNLEKLDKLEELRLNNNNISGNIPPSLGTLKKLRYLSLSSNKLSGNIPELISLLPELQYLFLHKNQLNGTIPKKLLELQSLKEITLNSNLFSGAIPNFSLIPSLEVCALHDLGNVCKFSDTTLENEVDVVIPTLQSPVEAIKKVRFSRPLETSLKPIKRPLSSSALYGLGNSTIMVNPLKSAIKNKKVGSKFIPGELGNLHNNYAYLTVIDALTTFETKNVDNSDEVEVDVNATAILLVREDFEFISNDKGNQYLLKWKSFSQM